ncbi:MAG: HEAT repeat domain-containing protein [Bradymonadaceae bacterium]
MVRPEPADATDEQLRARLRDGDRVERVRAAWELGLRLEDEIVGLLVECLVDEPHAGVRRHFATILAGYGEIDQLARLARRDESPYVRAAAVRHLAREAPAESTWDLLAERFDDDPSDRVRASVVERAPIELLVRPEDSPRLLAALRGDRRRLRRAGVARLDPWPDPLHSRLADAAPGLALEESDPHLRARWLARLWRSPARRRLLSTAEARGQLAAIADELAERVGPVDVGALRNALDEWNRESLWALLPLLEEAGTSARERRQLVVELSSRTGYGHSTEGLSGRDRQRVRTAARSLARTYREREVEVDDREREALRGLERLRRRGVPSAGGLVPHGEAGGTPTDLQSAVAEVLEASPADTTESTG